MEKKATGSTKRAKHSRNSWSLGSGFSLSCVADAFEPSSGVRSSVGLAGRPWLLAAISSAITGVYLDWALIGRRTGLNEQRATASLGAEGHGDREKACANDGGFPLVFYYIVDHDGTAARPLLYSQSISSGDHWVQDRG